MSHKISIIIPSYKNEDTIERCINSINANDYKNIEIIICSELGVSKARNEGLKKATGDIITFCDADDYIEPDTFTKVIEAFDKTSADIIYTGYNEYNGDNKRHSILRFPGEFVEEERFRNLIINDIEVLGTVWNKFYKAEVLEGIFFDEDINLCEDTLFNLHVLSKGRLKIFSLDSWTYNYVRRSQSLTLNTSNHYDSDNNLRYLIAFDKALDLFPDDKQFKASIGYKKFTLATENYRNELDNEKKEKLRSVIKNNLKYVLTAKDAPSKTYFLSQAIKALTGKK